MTLSSETSQPTDPLAKPSSRIKRLAWIGLTLAIAAAFIAVKLSYPTFDQETQFRDSLSYAAGAEIPLSSGSFWAGERSFTLPLALKLLGVNTQNYKLPATLAEVGRFQTWFSVACWLLLGLAVARSLRNRWIQLLGFAIVLFFSASYEISQWDMHLLSESISFSLLALLIAALIYWLSLPIERFRSLFGYAALAGVILVTVLYSFTRDSNPYFVVMAAGLLAIAAFFLKTMRPQRTAVWVYFAAAIGLFLVQNATINIGNRWQIMIYDNLYYRVLQDPEMKDVFVTAGLPVSERLLEISQMRAAVYQDLIQHDPQLEPVRQWTNAFGKTTYVGYLLTHPKYTFWTPLAVGGTIIDGTGEGYRQPRNPNQAIPSGLVTLTRLIFPTGSKYAAAILLVLFVGISMVALWRGRGNHAWLAVIILLVPVYPLLVLVWNVNPIEITRHAEQIAIQLRLGGWMALLLGLDWLLMRKPPFFRRREAQ